MPIDPRVISSPGDPAGIATRMADLDRRLRATMAKIGQQAENSITGVAIAANTITASEIAAGSITAGHILAGVITASHLAANSVTANAIAANAIQANHIAAGQIVAGHLAAGSVTAAAIEAGTITATQIAVGTITAQNIASNTITATQIAAGTITATQIAADTITATQIAANAITAVELAANSITSNHIQANAVTANAVSANSIYTAALQAGAVTSDKITVSTLSALTTNMGSITAGTITGGTLQTASSGSRVVMNSSGLTGYALNGTTKVFEINVGTGIASFTGIANIDPASVIPGGTITTGTLPGDRIVSASVQTLQLAAGAVTANIISAGAVTAQKLSVIWGGGNTLFNSRFRDGVNQWGLYQHVAGNSLAQDTTVGHSGTTSGKITAGGAGSTQLGVVYLAATADRPRFIPGQTWTGSAYMRTSAASQRGFLLLAWYDAGGAFLGSSAGSTVALPTGSTWARATVTGVIPSGAAYGGLYAIAEQISGAAIPAGNLYWYTDLQLEPGEVASGYSPRPDEILPGSVGNTQIAPDSITTDKILASTIQGGDISASTITGTNIAASTITADRLSVTTLSAITADMGTLTAGTITGGIVRSSATSTRVQMDTTGVYALQAGTQTFKLDAVTGMVTQGKRFSASNQVHWNAFPTTDSVTIQVSADVSLVHIFVEVEVWADLGNVIVALVESTDIPSLQILSAGGASWQFVRTIPGSTIGTSNKLAGYISYRPTQGTRTYSLAYSAPTDQANSTNAYIRNRLIHVFTS